MAQEGKNQGSPRHQNSEIRIRANLGRDNGEVGHNDVYTVENLMETAMNGSGGGKKKGKKKAKKKKKK